MKIFISHSSADKWAAKRISDDLIELGAETFLDEKDIKTGESIDQKIKTNLKDCNDFLVLLSPASLKSEWVLVELGGAFALEKNVIPILLYVGANELPKIINLRLSRDINLIQLYYDEVSKNITGQLKAVKPTKIQKPALSKNRLKVGDKVKIISDNPGDLYRENMEMLHFNELMEAYLGQIAIITQPHDEHGNLRLDIDNEMWSWAEEWLIKIH